MRRESIDGHRIWVIHNFLSSGECCDQIEFSRTLGYREVDTYGEKEHAYRESDRAMGFNPVLAKLLWNRAVNHVLTSFNDEPAAGLHPLIRYLRYTGNQHFAPHSDVSANLGGLHTRFTFIIYLADVAQGGETQFFDDDHKATFAVRPEAGKALVFEHPIRHEGVAVESGAKYLLRTDVLYGRDRAILDALERP